MSGWVIVLHNEVCLPKNVQLFYLDSALGPIYILDTTIGCHFPITHHVFCLER